MIKRSKSKTSIATIDNISRPLAIISKIARARTVGDRITVSSRPGKLVLSARLEKTGPRLGQTEPCPGRVWIEYAVPAEGALSQELGFDPRLFKVAVGTAKGIAIEVKSENVVEKNQPVLKVRADITDPDGVTTECHSLGSDCVEMAPSFEGHEWGRATVGEFMGPFSWAYRAISTDERRPHLAATALIGSRVVGTDGHRLHVAGLPNGINVGFESLIPSIAARALLEIFKASSKNTEAKLSGNEQGMRFEIGGWSLTVRFPEARFPPYLKVIPSPWDRSGGIVVKADSGKLLKAMKKAQVVLKGATNSAVLIRPEEKLVRVTADNIADDLKAEIKIPASVRGSVGFDFGANVDYVVDALLDSGEVEIFIGPEATIGTYEAVGFSTGINEEKRQGTGHTTDASVFSVGLDQFAVVMPVRL